MGAEPETFALAVVELVPLGDVPRDVTDALVRLLSRRVGVPCRVVRGVPADLLPRLPQRPQLDADAVLATLEARDAREGVARVGVTTEDLGHPLFTFFFGRARMGGAALVSLHRLDPAFHGLPRDTDRMLARAVVECLHELGHVAGLHHCGDHGCVMRFSGDVDVLDVRGHGFCATCAAALPRTLRHALHG